MNDTRIDACGMLCPMPLVLGRRALQQAPPGTVALVRADDPQTLKRLPEWSKQAGIECLAVRTDGAAFELALRRLP